MDTPAGWTLVASGTLTADGLTSSASQEDRQRIARALTVRPTLQLDERSQTVAECQERIAQLEAAGDHEGARKMRALRRKALGRPRLCRDALTADALLWRSQ